MVNQKPVQGYFPGPQKHYHI